MSKIDKKAIDNIDNKYKKLKKESKYYIYINKFISILYHNLIFLNTIINTDIY